MSTVASIAAKTEKGYKVIYVQYDGGLSYTGQRLAENYNTPEKVSELMDAGSLASLPEDIDYCERYNEFCKVVATEEDAINLNTNIASFTYLWDGDCWNVVYWADDNEYKLHSLNVMFGIK